MVDVLPDMQRLTSRKVMKFSLWAVAGIVALLTLSVIALMLTLSSEKLNLPAVDVGALPAASPPPGMSISALPTGTYDGPAAMMFNGGAWGDHRNLTMTAVLVRHPKGNLLIDMGAGRDIDAHFKLLPLGQQFSAYVKATPVVTQLAAAGLKTSDIAAIIPTHAHWDHVSGIEDLPGVPVMETREGKSYIDGKPEGTEVINSFRNLKYRFYRFDGGPYLGFPKSHDVFGDGSVVIVPAPGHTPDSVAVFVSLPSGKRYAFIGDLVFQGEGLQLPAEKPWIMRKMIGEKDEVVHRDIALFRAVQAEYPQFVIVPAHEARAFAAIPKFPAAAR